MRILRSASTLGGAAGLCACGLILLRCSSSTPGATGSNPDAAQDGSLGDGGTASCGFDAGFDGGVRTYGPYDPHIQYVGRLDLSDPAGPWFAESATYITAKFRGNSVSALIQDENYAGDQLNFFDVIIDDRPPFVLTLSRSSTSYDLTPVDDGGTPIQLSCGEHTVTLIKRTEATVGKDQFHGFQVAEILPPEPPPSPLHKIEIVGDSWACGFGVEAPSPSAPQCSQNGLGQSGYGQGVEDGYKAYGAVLARLLNAQWHITCEGGIGLVRNNLAAQGIGPRPMPQIYPYLYPNTYLLEDSANQALWAPTQWGALGDAAVPGTPDLVVVGLGGNDLSLVSADGGTLPSIPVGSLDASADSGPTFVHGFVDFIAQLAADYPGASIFLVSDAEEVQTAVEEVVSYYAPGGGGATAKLHVYGYNLAMSELTGCQGHPSVSAQAEAGAHLAAYIRQVMGWSGSDSGTDSGVLPPNTKLVPLTADNTGHVASASGTSPNTVGVTGHWYAFGDGWGTEGYDGGTGVAGERGTCELVGGFPVSDCSSITSPLPPAPEVDGGADAAPTPDYANGFPSTPAGSQTFCLSGTGGAVLTHDGGTSPDYSDIYGIGSGFDFNNVGGVKSAYNAPDHKVIGVQFTVTSKGIFFPPLRVTFATTDTADDGGTGDSYDFSPSANRALPANGTYQVLWTNLESPYPPVPGLNVGYLWSGPADAQPRFNPAHLLWMDFYIPTNPGSPVSVDDLCVSDLSAIIME